MASKREGVMLCYPYDEKRFLNQYGSQGLIQRKFNGDRCKAVIKDGEAKLYSSQANEIKHVQHINEELSSFPNMVLDGELYVHGMAHQDIRSIVAQKYGPSAQSHVMEYHVFDIINDKPQFERVADLLRHFSYRLMKKVHLVSTKVVLSVEEIEDYYVQFVKEGFEGFILRNPKGLYKEKRSTDIMKCKPRCQSVARVVVMHMAHTNEGQPKNMLGALEVLDEDLGVSLRVGTGFTEQQRKAIWSKGNKRVARERIVYMYQELSREGVPIFPVFKRWSKEENNE